MRKQLDRQTSPTRSNEALYALSPSAIYRSFANQGFAFWMACGYLFFEYIRPQAIWPAFDAFPYWGRTFILLALIGWFLDPQRRFIWTATSTGIALFTLVIILSSMTAYWPDISWANFMIFFNWVVIFFGLTQIVTTRARFYIILLIFLIASFKLSQYGARTWAMMGFSFSDWGLRGPQGFFENPGEYAIQMVVFFPIALFFCFAVAPYLKKRWHLYVLYLMPITAFMATIGTNTRGGQLALAAQVLALILMVKHRFKALLLATLLAVAGYQLLPEEQKARFESAGTDITSLQRLLYWQHGWQMMKDHPVLGVGYYNFVPFYNQHHFDDIILPMLQLRGSAELPHNIFIQVGADAGFIGLGVFLLLILGAFLTMRKLGKAAAARDDPFVSNIAIGMNLSLLGYVFAGQFVSVAYYPYLWIHLAFVTMIHTFWRSEQGAPDSELRWPGGKATEKKVA